MSCARFCSSRRDGLAFLLPTPDGDGLLMLKAGGRRQTSAVNGTILFTTTPSPRRNERSVEPDRAAPSSIISYSPDLADSDLGVGTPTVGADTAIHHPVMMLLVLTPIVAAIFSEAVASVRSWRDASRDRPDRQTTAGRACTRGRGNPLPRRGPAAIRGLPPPRADARTRRAHPLRSRRCDSRIARRRPRLIRDVLMIPSPPGDRDSSTWPTACATSKTPCSAPYAPKGTAHDSSPTCRSRTHESGPAQIDHASCANR